MNDWEEHKANMREKWWWMAVMVCVGAFMMGLLMLMCACGVCT